MTYPVIITSAIGTSSDVTTTLISVTVIGCGIATILQAITKVGSGYPIPIIPNSSYLPASLLAATGGGLPMLYGMYIIAGLFEMAISRITRFFRILFPEEVVGVVLLLLGIAIVPFAFPLFFGSTNSGALDPMSTAVGIITLATMIILSTIPKRIFKFYSTLIGIVVGMIAAVILGVFSLEKFQEISLLDVFSVPNFAFLGQGYAFNVALLVPFFIGVICIVMKTTANISIMNNYTGKGNEKEVRKGLFSEGLGLGITGALGGIGVGTSSSAVGLVVSTGIASRKIGIGIGILLILCGFFPIFGWIFSVIPKPILGAVLIYAVGFVMVSGLQSITSRMLDNRRIFVVTLPVLIGVSSAVCPYLYSTLPSWLETFFSSALTSGAFAAVILGLLFRIGISRHKNYDLNKINTHDAMIDAGKSWTLNREQVSVISRDFELLARQKKAISLNLEITKIRDKMIGHLKYESGETETLTYSLI